MKVKITNLYNNEASRNLNLKGAHGQSFLIEFENEKILFDTGWKGNLLLSNMRTLGVDPNEIDKLILSHGHIDHTGGMPAFLEARTSNRKLTVIAHPAFREPKYAKKFGIRIVNLSAPDLDLYDDAKLVIQEEQGWYEITPFLSYTGEVLERLQKEGTSEMLVHRGNKNEVYEKDPLVDDISLVLNTSEGLVLICGCAHAGLLNIMAHVSRHFSEKQKWGAVIGGTHMKGFSRDEVDDVCKKLERDYGKPKLYFNHCTGKKVMNQVREYFGDDIAKPCLVGTVLEYECAEFNKVKHSSNE